MKTLSNCCHLEAGSLNLVRMLMQVHVTKHHDAGEEESGGVGKVFAGNVRSSSMDGFKDGSVCTNVATGSESLNKRWKQDFGKGQLHLKPIYLRIYLLQGRVRTTLFRV